jgi:hypothetical protein
LKQTTTGSNNKYTIPVIILTDPGIDKIVDPSSTTTENLTIILMDGDPVVMVTRESWSLSIVRFGRVVDWTLVGVCVVCY